MRRTLTLAALAIPSLLGAGIGAPAALAADDCPNAAIRAQQQSQHLPNCLAYERVSPANTNGAPTKLRAATADGNRTLNESMVALDGSVGTLGVSSFTSTRPVDGSTDWLVRPLAPPFTQRMPMAGEGPNIDGWSDDMERMVVRTLFPINANDRGELTQRGTTRASEDVYLREADGSFSWLVPDPTAVDTSMLPVGFVGASSDLDRVVVATARQFDPRVTSTNTVQHLYVRSDDGMQLATILPDGSLAPSVVRPNQTTAQFRAVSADGRRVAFGSTIDGEERLFVRVNADDPATAETREVSVGPAGQRCVGEAFLLSMSADGSKVLFSCDAALLPDAPARGVYLRDLDGGADALQLVGPAYQAPLLFGGNADFSRIYMGNVGDDQSYVVIRDGVPEKIATGTPRFSADAEVQEVAVSPDGEYFAFTGKHDYGVPDVDLGPPGSDVISDPSRIQAYLYSDRTGELKCVSCHQDGRPTTGVARFKWPSGYLTASLSYTNSVSDDGSVTFSTSTELDPQDSNGKVDAYAWVDGRQVLLSSGSSRLDSLAAGISADGRSMFLTTADSLVPFDRDGEAYSLYAVRAGGGVLVPEDEECVANCQPPAPERPILPNVGSGFVGRGNLVEAATEPTKRATASLTASRSVRGTRTTVRVKVSGAGSIRVSGSGLRQATVKAKKAGTYRVTVRLSAYGSAQQKKRGRLSTKLTARFTPQSGAAVQARKSVVFTAAKKGGR